MRRGQNDTKQTSAEAASITTAIEWPTGEAPLFAVLLEEAVLPAEVPVGVVSVGDESEVSVSVSVGDESEVSVSVSVGEVSEVSVGEAPVAATLPEAPDPVNVALGLRLALGEFDAGLGAKDAAAGLAFDELVVGLAFDGLVVVAAPAAFGGFGVLAAEDEVGTVGGIDVIDFGGEPPLLPVGGGTAAPALASLPMPHGIAWPVPG